MKPIYLDNSAFARPSPRAVQAMVTYFSDLWGSPQMPHRRGQKLHAFMRRDYEKLYRFLGAEEEDTFLFTSSGAEAINQVYECLRCDLLREGKKKALVTSAIEEAPILMCISRLEEEGLAIGRMVEPNRGGVVTAEGVAEQLTEETALVSLSYGNGLLGTLCEAKAIIERAHVAGALVHLDVTHALGKVDLSFRELDLDFLTFTGEAIHAPVGTGGLLAHARVALAPLIVGGLEQGGWRAGSFNMPAFGGLVEAIVELQESQDYLCTEIARLRALLEQQVADQLAGEPFAPLFPFRGAELLPHVAVMTFPGIANEPLLYLLDGQGVAASIGGGHFQQLALLAEACGLEAEIARSMVSFSLSRDTDQPSIEQAAELIAMSVRQLSRCRLAEEEKKGWD